jgi:redox-sensitive bicupin YhaK (pirin superfamily)
MSYLDAEEARCQNCEATVQRTITGRAKDLGSFSVRRILPAADQRQVGPFVFFDHMGPADFPPGVGIDVRPHPHIGLATITYLFEGEILHRDSLGCVQPIRPGAVNLMTAGRGIVHSERSGAEERARASRLHGIQSWMALPADHEETEPAFEHTPAEDLPRWSAEGVEGVVILGAYQGRRSPIKTLADMIYLDLQLSGSADFELPPGFDERALYVVDGCVGVGQETVESGTMAVLAPGRVAFRAATPSRVMVIGGESLGPRRLWWNFVARSPERIEQAKADWAEGRFAQVPGETEFIPLPD